MSVEDDRVRAYTAERRGEEKGTKEKTQRQGEESHERRPQEKREEGERKNKNAVGKRGGHEVDES